MKLPVRLLPLLLLPLLTGCIHTVRDLQNENRRLSSQVMQYRQDFQALESQHEKATAELASLRKRATDAETEAASLKERMTSMRQVLEEAQKTQAEALLQDVQDRLERENNLRLELENAKSQLEAYANDKTLLESEIEAIQAEMLRLKEQLEARGGELEAGREKAARLEAERDDARTERDDFRRQVQALRSSNEETSAQIEDLSGKLRDAEKELAAAKRRAGEFAAEAARAETARHEAAQTATRQQTQLAEDLRTALAGELATEDISLDADDGHVTIAILSDALFQPGTVLLSDRGRALLDIVAGVLEKAPFEALAVEGHTDNRPVQNMPFVDNWDLAASRASSVTRYLAAHEGISGKRLSATSKSFFEPIATNDTATGRKQNRRVEIRVLAGR